MDVLSDPVRDLGLNSDCDQNEILSSVTSRRFNMDHILENVLSNVSLNTVYSCRFVSHRWAFLGSHEAQKRYPWIRFKLDKETGRPKLRCKSSKNLFLSDLIPLMDSSTAGFPCSSFIICSSLFQQPVVQQFLNVQGARIKRLDLTEPPYRYKFQKEPIHEYVVHTRLVKQYEQTITFSNLTRLLLVQCLHIQVFKCSARIEVQATADSETSDDPDELAAMVWRSKERNPDFKFNFKVFVIQNRSLFPEKLLQAILLCSPCLKKVLLETCNVNCLAQPVNRLHFLKWLTLWQNDLADPNCLNALDQLVKHADENWPLTVLRLDGSCLFDKPHLWSRVTHIINRILQVAATSSTCRSIEYYGLDFLEGIRIPQIRTVEYLSLFVRKGFKTFPGGATLGETFPNLRTLHIRCKYPTAEIYPLLDVFNSLEPMPGVENVRLLLFREPQFAEGVKGLFPNAQVKNITC